MKTDKKQSKIAVKDLKVRKSVTGGTGMPAGTTSGVAGSGTSVRSAASESYGLAPAAELAREMKIASIEASLEAEEANSVIRACLICVRLIGVSAAASIRCTRVTLCKGP